VQPNQDGESEEIELWTPTGKDFDVLIVQMQDLAAAVEKLIERVPQSQTQTVIHKQSGMGATGVVCAAICALCVIFLVVELNRIDGRLRDLDAWRSVHSNDIGALKADVRQLQKGTGK
jgi:hypothetical protein